MSLRNMCCLCVRSCRSCKTGCVPDCCSPLIKGTPYVEHLFALSFFYNGAERLGPPTVLIGCQVSHMT